MPLVSRFFSGNTRLQECSRTHARHVTPGETGGHVALIQNALIMLDNASIDGSELDNARYGPSTAKAVLAYKTKYDIVNRSYQQAADDIVGIMTIDRLDKQMAALEAPFSFLGGGGLIPGLLFAPKIGEKKPRLVIVSETSKPWLPWADQVVTSARLKLRATLPAAEADDSVRLVKIGDGASAAASAGALMRAAGLAGPLGILILSVGHGAAGDKPANAAENDFGIFDLGPSHNFQIGGRSAWLVGQPKPKDIDQVDGRLRPFPSATSAFYADRPPSSSGISVLSELENDKDNAARGSRGAAIRLANWASYQQVCTAFTPLGLIVLLTCNVGSARGLLRKARQQFATPILGYKRYIEGDMVNGRGRVYLEGDRPGEKTNTPAGEVMIPISFPDMALII
jgi:hypothetical protein